MNTQQRWTAVEEGGAFYAVGHSDGEHVMLEATNKEAADDEMIKLLTKKVTAERPRSGGLDMTLKEALA